MLDFQPITTHTGDCIVRHPPTPEAHHGRVLGVGKRHLMIDATLTACGITMRPDDGDTTTPGRIDKTTCKRCREAIHRNR